MPEKLDVAVLSITGVDVVLSTVPSFAHHVVGTHSRQGNTGRPRSEAALLGSKLDGSWAARRNPEAFSFPLLHAAPHSPALGPGPWFWHIRPGTPSALKAPAVCACASVGGIAWAFQKLTLAPAQNTRTKN